VAKKPRGKKKDEQPEGPMDPDAAEYLANRDKDLNEAGMLTPEEYQIARAARIWSFDDTGHDLTVDKPCFAVATSSTATRWRRSAG
jgi:hypothetical protein